jgi:DNA-directed RNA polymerase subunit RPC12/RpoP
MSVPKLARCPDCGGNLYLEPDLVEAMADLVCLQCSRRFRHGRGPGPSVAGSLPPSDRTRIRAAADAAGDRQ